MARMARLIGSRAPLSGNHARYGRRGVAFAILRDVPMSSSAATRDYCASVPERYNIRQAKLVRSTM
jgi:hypothetical protein